MKILKYLLIILLIGAIGAGIYFYPKYKQAKLIQEASKPENIGYTFIHMDEFFQSKTVEKSPKPFIYPKGETITLPESFTYQGDSINTAQYLDSTGTQGLMVLQNDTMVFETYMNGQKEATRHISWSVAKSFVSAMFGIAMEEGHIKSIDQTVDEYLPELKGTGYEGVKIKDVLQMSSGVKFDENYSDPKSDINRWFLSFALGNSQDKFATTLVNEREPGTYNHYVSINTHVLGMIIVRATGKSLTDYMKEKITDKLGMEHDAYWLKDNKDMEMALGGLNVTLRDYAKLGTLFLHKGNWQGEQIVPESWVTASTTPDAPHVMPNADASKSAHDGIGYGYQWWVADGDEGEFLAVGVFNQFIYINPTTNTVIVKNSANPIFLELDNTYRGTLIALELFREIAHGIN